MTASLTDCVGYYSLEEGCGYLALVVRLLARVTLVAQWAAEPVVGSVTLRAVAAGFE